jgi:hypothetical protein
MIVDNFAGGGGASTGIAQISTGGQMRQCSPASLCGSLGQSKLARVVQCGGLREGEQNGYLFCCMD